MLSPSFLALVPCLLGFAPTQLMPRNRVGHFREVVSFAPVGHGINMATVDDDAAITAAEVQEIAKLKEELWKRVAEVQDIKAQVDANGSEQVPIKGRSKSKAHPTPTPTPKPKVAVEPVVPKAAPIADSAKKSTAVAPSSGFNPLDALLVGPALLVLARSATMGSKAAREEKQEAPGTDSVKKLKKVVKVSASGGKKVSEPATVAKTPTKAAPRFSFPTFGPKRNGAGAASVEPEIEAEPDFVEELSAKGAKSLGSVTRRMESLEKQLLYEKRQKNAAELKLSQAKQELEKMAPPQVAQRALEAAEAAVARSKEELEALKSENAKQRESAAAAAAELKKGIASLPKLEKESTAKAEELKKLKTELQAMRLEMSAAISDKNMAEKAAAPMQKQVAKLEASLASSSASLASSSAQVAAKGEENSALNKELAAAQAELSDSSAAYEKKINYLRDLYARAE